jgi:hypothetical protein
MRTRIVNRLTAGLGVKPRLIARMGRRCPHKQEGSQWPPGRRETHGSDCYHNCPCNRGTSERGEAGVASEAIAGVRVRIREVICTEDT